ncbi:MAG: hypothetical protein BWY82_02967 [Verrucomicrobia bacterium ADurb.Bin474]|nr:MAG: hypothetical protein BWY82_02967 [Verrucomicrobia bacterium ADurb.Bin474]
MMCGSANRARGTFNKLLPEHRDTGTKVALNVQGNRIAGRLKIINPT